ncbi:MAG: homoserine dehydrogenase [Parvularcula sp.]
MKVSIAGLGTVGAGLVALLAKNERLAHQGLQIEIGAVSARSQSKDRGVDLSCYRWVEDPVALAKDPETELFVELIGGADGPAKEAVEAALSLGKPVVTANKALIAEHGVELAALAEANGVPLLFEAAVAAGTPVIRGIKDGTAPCDVVAVRGILNGTCNYILSRMSSDGALFDDILKDAQEAGIAEADPGLDVDGFDAAHKIAILSIIAFDMEFDFSAVSVSGIRQVCADDIRIGEELGYVVKLIGEAILVGGELAIRVMPAMVPRQHLFANISGTDNIVTAQANPLGRLSFGGPGAGAGATASAVASDICAIARGQAAGPVFSGPVETLRPAAILAADRLENAYFLWAEVDHQGTEEALHAALSSCGIEVETVRSIRSVSDQPAFAIVTQACSRTHLDEAMTAFNTNSFVTRISAAYPVVDQ